MLLHFLLFYLRSIFLILLRSFFSLSLNNIKFCVYSFIVIESRVVSDYASVNSIKAIDRKMFMKTTKKKKMYNSYFSKTQTKLSNYVTCLLISLFLNNHQSLIKIFYFPLFRIVYIHFIGIVHWRSFAQYMHTHTRFIYYSEIDDHEQEKYKQSFQFILTVFFSFCSCFNDWTFSEKHHYQTVYINDFHVKILIVKKKTA